MKLLFQLLNAVYGNVAVILYLGYIIMSSYMFNIISISVLQVKSHYHQEYEYNAFKVQIVPLTQ